LKKNSWKYKISWPANSSDLNTVNHRIWAWESCASDARTPGTAPDWHLEWPVAKHYGRCYW